MKAGIGSDGDGCDVTRSCIDCMIALMEGIAYLYLHLQTSDERSS